MVNGVLNKHRPLNLERCERRRGRQSPAYTCEGVRGGMKSTGEGQEYAAMRLFRRRNGSPKATQGLTHGRTWALGPKGWTKESRNLWAVAGRCTWFKKHQTLA